MRSSLASRTASEATPAELTARQQLAAIRAIREANILMFRLDDPRLDDFERQVGRNIAAKLYGVR